MSDLSAPAGAGSDLTDTTRVRPEPGFLRGYLDRAPVSHSIWRTREARAMRAVSYEGPLLDLGCGFGEFAGVFFKSSVEVGLDIAERDLAMAVGSGKYGSVILGDARRLPLPDASLATVISVSVLEHIAGLDELFHEVARVLRPGGNFVYTVPTPDLNREMLVPTAFNKLRVPGLAKAYCRLYHRLFRHISVLTTEEWTGLATRSGLEVTRVEGTLSRRALRAFEAFLPAAIPSQVSKTLFGRRPNLSPGWLRSRLHDRIRPLVEEESDSTANILVVATKPPSWAGTPHVT